MTAFVLHEPLEASVIAAIVGINGWIALAQEAKASRAIASLETFQVLEAKVVRDGVASVIASVQVVTGDLVLLAAGDRVPADCLLIEARDLTINESLLTGESLPVPKRREGSAFLGTMIERGSGRAVVSATGRRTRLGSIVALVQEVPPKTPLQSEFDRITSRLGTVAVMVAALVVAITAPRLGIQEAMLTGVALAVAAVPEGLASIVTIALALGVRRMAEHGTVIRRLSAVETLGCTDVLLTDKTGTLTLNSMKVSHVWIPGEPVVRTEEGSDTAPTSFLRILTLCNDATLEPPVGDPMEIALLEWVGADLVREIRNGSDMIDTVPFDATRKRMTTLHSHQQDRLVSMKGAPEVIIPLCTRFVEREGSAQPLDPKTRRATEQAALEMAQHGARVLALAERVVREGEDDLAALEVELTLVGLVGLRDPVRPEAAGAVTSIRGAGVDVVMVTGDHPSTAASIGRDVGISATTCLTGDDLRDQGLPDDPLSHQIYARVEPEEKLALVRALRDRGHVVAVTGDGVNDAPALRHADIGVAMGHSGTDAAREAADMVVTDDNLATVAAAIKEGRGIYDNIRKVVEYLVASNLSEVLVMIVALIAFPALGVPLLPLQLLWINLLTDALPAIALGLDPIDPEVMSRRPRVREQKLLNAVLLRKLAARAALMASASFTTLIVAVHLWSRSWYQGRALMFMTLAASQLFYAFTVRSGRVGERRIPNRLLALSALAGGGLLIGITATPGLRNVFDTVWMSPRELVLVICCSALPAALIEVSRRGRRRS